MNRICLLLFFAFLLISCTERKNVRVAIEIDDMLEFIEEDYSKDSITDTLFTIKKKVKFYIYANNPNSMIAVNMTDPVRYLDDEVKGLFLTSGYGNFAHERMVINDGRHDVVTGDEYFLMYKYGFAEPIAYKDVRTIRDYFINKGTVTYDTIYENDGFRKEWSGVSLQEFEKAFPEHYQKYINTKKDSIAVESRRIRIFGNHSDYKEERFGVDYNLAK